MPVVVAVMSGAINLPLALGALKGTVSALFGCVPGGKSQNARLVTGLLFFLYVFAMFGVRYSPPLPPLWAEISNHRGLLVTG